VARSNATDRGRRNRPVALDGADALGRPSRAPVDLADWRRRRQPDPDRRTRIPAPAQVGASNSRPGFKTSTAAAGVERPAGVDSVSFAWRPTGPAGDDLIARLRAREGRLGGAGAHVLNDRLAGDARVVVFESVIAVEGRLGALLRGDEGEHRLWDWRALGAGADVARARLLRLVGTEGKDPGLGGAEVRRLDLAGELRFDRGADGLAFLDALAGLRAPRCKTVAWRKDAAPQTVYWVADRSRQVKMRAYDKGVESGTHEPGERVRVELQHRPPKSRRRRPDVLAGEDLRSLFIGGLGGWAAAPYDVTRGEPEHVMAVLLDRVEHGELSRRKAEALVGQLVGLRVDAAAGLGKQARNYRLRELRRAGVVIDRPAEVRTVPVVEHLAELRERFAA
jgi:hypothetical protein